MFLDDMRAQRAFADQGLLYGLTDAQRRAGLAFLGRRVPPLELHNELWQEADRKLNWIFAQLEGVRDQAQLRNQSGGVIIANPEYNATDSTILARSLGLYDRAYAGTGYHMMPGKLLLTWGLAIIPATGNPASGVTINLPQTYRAGIYYSNANPRGAVNAQLGYIPSVRTAPVGVGQLRIDIDAGGTVINQNVEVAFFTLGA